MRSCTGKVLRVDLTAGTTAVEKIPDEVYEAVLSGKGLGAWYLYKNIPAGARPAAFGISGHHIFQKSVFYFFIRERKNILPRDRIKAADRKVSGLIEQRGEIRIVRPIVGEHSLAGI